VETVNERLRVTAPGEAGAAVNRALAERGIYASMIAPRRSSLEDLFLELTEEAVAPAAAPVELSGDRW
jgi:hypothetical protein